MELSPRRFTAVTTSLVLAGSLCAVNAPTTAYALDGTPEAVALNGAEDALDFASLPNGEYSIDFHLLHIDKSQNSMADRAADRDLVISVQDGVYTIRMNLTPLNVGVLKGYLANLKYLDDAQVFQPSTSLETYSVDEDPVTEKPATYPKSLSFPLSNQAKASGEQKLELYIPMMEALGLPETPGMGTKQVWLSLEKETVKKLTPAKEAEEDKKVTEDAPSEGSGNTGTEASEVKPTPGSEVAPPNTTTSTESEATGPKEDVGEAPVSGDPEKPTDKETEEVEKPAPSDQGEKEVPGTGGVTVETSPKPSEKPGETPSVDGASDGSQAGNAPQPKPSTPSTTPSTPSTGAEVHTPDASEGGVNSSSEKPKPTTLADGEYTADYTILKDDMKGPSMANAVKDASAHIVAKNGKYTLVLNLKGANIRGITAYLGSLKYADAQGVYQPVAVLETVTVDGVQYPQKISLPLSAEALQSGKQKIQVFVPVMEKLMAGQGTKEAWIALDTASLTKINSATPGTPTDQGSTPTPSQTEATTPSANTTAPQAGSQTPQKPHESSANNALYKNLSLGHLADGEYSLVGDMIKADKSGESMANKALDHNVKLEVIKGKYYATLTFKGIKVGSTMGYLGSIKYADDAGVFQPAEVIESIVVDGVSYPSVVRIPLNSQATTDGWQKLQVFVQAMEDIAAGSGTQEVYLKLSGDTLKEGYSSQDSFYGTQAETAGKRLPHTGDTLPALPFAVAALASALALLRPMSRRNSN